MTEEEERIYNTVNMVAPSPAPIGRNDPTALSTEEGKVYRETGEPQIQDIIECGCVRYNPKRPSKNVWWTYGGPNSFHVNKKPIIVASLDKVKHGQQGAIPIQDLEEIWKYNEEKKQWENKIDEIYEMYLQGQKEKGVSPGKSR